MATVTRFAGGNGLGGLVYYDYDDATLFMTAARCVNGGPVAVTIQVTQTATTRTYSRACPAGQTTEQKIGTNAAQRMALTVTPNGKLDGIDWEIH